MLSFMRWMLPTSAAVAMLVGFSTLPVRAVDQPTDVKKGTVTGTVIDKDGKAVANAEVGLTKPPPKEKDKGAKPAAANQSAKPLAEDNTKKADKKKAEPLFHATTDAEGKFTIKDVPAGTYLAVARVDGKIRSREKVVVPGDGTATVKLTLKDATAKTKAK